MGPGFKSPGVLTCVLQCPALSYPPGKDRPSPARGGARVQGRHCQQAATRSLTQGPRHRVGLSPSSILGNCSCLSVLSRALRNPWIQHRRTAGVPRPTSCVYSVPTPPPLPNAILPGLLRKASHLYPVPVGSGREGLPWPRLSPPPLGDAWDVAIVPILPSRRI